MADELQPANWDKLLASDKFVGNIEADKEKVLVIKLPVSMRTVEKFGEKLNELVATCVEEDGEKCEKQWTPSSKRLLTKVRPIIEAGLKENVSAVKISILKVGDSYQTQYSVKRIQL